MKLLLYVDDACCLYDARTSSADYKKFMADLAADFKYTGGGDVDFSWAFVLRGTGPSTPSMSIKPRLYKKQ